MTRKLVPTLLALTVAMTMAGCDSESLADAQNDAEPAVAAATIAYDPSNGVLPLPNDLLFSDSQDGTLNPPVADPSDSSDPKVALSGLDGWSSNAPMSLTINLPENPENVSLDSSSLMAGVRLFETRFGGPTAAGDCAQLAQGVACQVVAELQFGVDFVAAASGGTVALLPLKPLKAKTGYLLVATDALKDSRGLPVAASSTYRLLKQDLASKPLGSAAQRQLQGLINSFEGALAAAGVTADSIIYSGAVTVQSLGDDLGVTRLLMAQQLQAGVASQLTLAPPAAVEGIATSADFLIAAGLLDGSSSAPAQVQARTIASAALVRQSSLSLPYLLEYPDAASNCPPQTLATTGNCAGLSSRWQAQGDSPATILGALNAGLLTAEKVVADCDLDSAAALANPANLVGCQIQLPAGQLDSERHLTKFNPLPLIRQWQSVPVLITVPDVTVVNALRAAQAGTTPEQLSEAQRLAKPASGWPTLIFVHGINRSKEDVHALAGTLALYGLATIAIDLPLHGQRGAKFNNDDIYEISASASLKRGGDSDPYQHASPLAFANLASLATVRDNLKQAASDQLALRAGLNYLAFALQLGQQPQLLDASKVSMAGHSLGASVATVAAALANEPLLDPQSGEVLATNPFALRALSLAMPGAGLAGVFGGSPAFGPLVEAGLTATDSFADAVSDELKVLLGDRFDEKKPGAARAALTALASENPAQYDALLSQAYPPFFNQFAFAAQSVIDSGDALNYAGRLAANTPALHLLEVVGNGADNLADRVIPNATSPEQLHPRLQNLQLPLVGTEPLIRLLGLPAVTASTGDGSAAVAAAVRFMVGNHGSLLSPAADEEASPDAASSAAATAEMQQQLGSFHASGGNDLNIANSSLLAAE